MASSSPTCCPRRRFFLSFYHPTSISLQNLSPHQLLTFAEWFFVPRVLAGGFCLLLPAAGILFGRCRWSALLALVLGLMFFWPPLFGTYIRYGFGYVYPFSLAIGAGVDWLAARAERGPRWGARLLGVVAVAAAVWWVGVDRRIERYVPLIPTPGGSHFLFAREPIAAGAGLARYLDALPEDGVMAPVGLVPSLAWGTDKRCLALPFRPEKLEAAIADYDVHYLVVARELLQSSGDARRDVATTRATARFIQEHPGRFRRVRVVEEDRPSYFRRRTFIVYRVLSSPGATSAR